MGEALSARAGVGGGDGGDVSRQEADDDGGEAGSVAIDGGGRVGRTKAVTGRRDVDEHRHQHRQT